MMTEHGCLVEYDGIAIIRRAFVLCVPWPAVQTAAMVIDPIGKDTMRVHEQACNGNNND